MPGFTTDLVSCGHPAFLSQCGICLHKGPWKEESGESLLSVLRMWYISLGLLGSVLSLCVTAVAGVGVPALRRLDVPAPRGLGLVPQHLSGAMGEVRGGQYPSEPSPSQPDWTWDLDIHRPAASRLDLVSPLFLESGPDWEGRHVVS